MKNSYYSYTEDEIRFRWKNNTVYINELDGETRDWSYVIEHYDEEENMSGFTPTIKVMLISKYLVKKWSTGLEFAAVVKLYEKECS